MNEIEMPKTMISEEDLKQAEQAVDILAELVGDVMDATAQMLGSFAADLGKAVAILLDSTAKLLVNQRVAHLALHAKKNRTRKKNQNRIRKEFRRFIKLWNI